MNLFAATGHRFKMNQTFGCCKKCMILTHTDIPAGVDLGAALADNDIAADHVFTTEFFDTKSLRLAVTTVS